MSTKKIISELSSKGFMIVKNLETKNYLAFQNNNCKAIAGTITSLYNSLKTN
jgi:hypothetical protein